MPAKCSGEVLGALGGVCGGRGWYAGENGDVYCDCHRGITLMAVDEDANNGHGDPEEAAGLFPDAVPLVRPPSE